MNNWYRIKRPFDSFTRNDIGRLVSFPGDIRHLGLEQLGYLENTGPDLSTLEISIPEVPAPLKRGRRGKQGADRQGEESAVREVPGDELRSEDLPSD